MWNRIPFTLTLLSGLAASAALAGEPASASPRGEPSNVLTDFAGVEIAPSATLEPVHFPQTLEPVHVLQSANGSAARSKAVGWLAGQQHGDGGWGSGGFGTNGAESSDVATTAFATLALHRHAAGSAANAAQIRKGLEFVIRAVETAPVEGPRLNTPEGTQIQGKLGPLVDTHLASLVLGEVAPTLSGDLQRRAKSALEVCVRKVERAQNADGSFDGNAWAPVLSSSIAAQGLYAANEAGIAVKDEVLRRSDDYQTGNADTKSGTFDTSAGAGVQLYAVASTMRSSTQTLGRDGANAAAPAAAQEAKAAADMAFGAVAATPDALIAGFGSVGGEEMLSYMMISDTLAEKGGGEWREWEPKISSFLAQAQNGDGSWNGHHCITSAPFATAGGILTLSAADHAAIVARRG